MKTKQKGKMMLIPVEAKIVNVVRAQTRIMRPI